MVLIFTLIPMFQVGRELGIAESTIRGWIKTEAKIREFADTVDTDVGLSRKRARLSTDPVLDKAVYSWFCDKRADGVPLSGPIIQSQAAQMMQELCPSAAPPPSRGWLDRWKARHAIRSIRIQGEIRSSDSDAAEAFLPQLQTVVEAEGLVPDQIWNADETGLYWRMTPQSTLAARTDTTASHGHKQAKERVTVLLACNWAGTHKPLPLVIGKSKSPRCFHHVNMQALPIVYNNSKNAWMTSSIFEDWFHKRFVPSARRHLCSLRLPEKGILLLDNCPAHPPASSLVSRDGNFRVVYLPKNTTSRIQPLDQGIIACFKRYYRTELIRAVVAEDASIIPFLKKMTIKDACYQLGVAWEQITAASIRATWDSALGNPFEHACPEEEEEEDFLGFTTEDVEAARAKLAAVTDTESLSDLLDTWAAIDDDLPVSTPQSDSDHLEAARGEEPEEEPEETTPPTQRYTLTQSLEALELLRGFYEQRGEKLKVIQTTTDLQRLKKELAATQKQKTMGDYFRKA